MTGRVKIIEYWYNRRERSWVVQLKDRLGNQVGDADYVGRLSHAKWLIGDYWKKFPEAKVVKTEIS